MRKILGLATAGVLGLSLLAAPVAAEDATCAPAEHAGGDWPMFGQNLQGSHSQPAEATIDQLGAATLAPAWTFDANAAAGTTKNEITGYPIVANGCVYVGTSTGFQTPGSIFALNADTGEVVWHKPISHAVYSTLAVSDGLVYAFVSRVAFDDGDLGPYVLAMDENTGATVWETAVDSQFGSDAVSSPIVYDGMVWVGLSGTVAEGAQDERFGLQGNFVLLDAATGAMIKKTYTIPESEWRDPVTGGTRDDCIGENEEESHCPSGGSQWGTISIDAETGFGYEGTGNPFNYNSEYKTTNAVLKIDLRKDSATFGEIVDSFKGSAEEYFPDLGQYFTCDENDPLLFIGLECLRLDLDFGAQAQIFKDSSGKTMVGEGQKSGVYWFLDPETMEETHSTIMGVPSLVGGIVGSGAYDGSNLYIPHTIAGYIASLQKDTGNFNWISPTADAVHWGNPVAHANGVLYTVDLKGFLDAIDTATGLPLRHLPMNTLETGTNPTFTWGGTTVARNTVYASVGVGLSSTAIGGLEMPNGFVIAYRPAA